MEKKLKTQDEKKNQIKAIKEQKEKLLQSGKTVKK